MQNLSLKEINLSNIPFGDLTTPPSQRDSHFGGKIQTSGDSIDYRRLKIAIGDQPISWKLKNIYKQTHSKIPTDLELFEEYDLWMIAHAISVLDRGEFATLACSSVEAVGYEAEFDKALVYNVGLLPTPEIVTNIGGGFKVAADLGISGDIKLPDSVKGLMDGDILAGDARLSSKVEAGIVGRLSFSVWTPKVTYSGICSSRCEWMFNRVDEPLLNSQLMFQLAIVPAGLKTLNFKVRAYALIRSIGWIPIPSRFETNWLDVSTSPVGILK